MKKIVLSFVLLFTCLIVNAQAFGAAGLDVKGTFSTTKPIYRQWLRLGNTTNVTMKFEQTAEGLKKAVDMAEQMLVKNGLATGSPDIYKSVMADKITLDNPEELNRSIQAGKSKVNMAWYSQDGSTLHLFLGPYSYELNVLDAYKVK